MIYVFGLVSELFNIQVPCEVGLGFLSITAFSIEERSGCLPETIN